MKSNQVCTIILGVLLIIICLPQANAQNPVFAYIKKLPVGEHKSEVGFERRHFFSKTNSRAFFLKDMNQPSSLKLQNIPIAVTILDSDPEVTVATIKSLSKYIVEELQISAMPTEGNLRAIAGLGSLVTLDLSQIYAIDSPDKYNVVNFSSLVRAVAALPLLRAIYLPPMRVNSEDISLLLDSSRIEVIELDVPAYNEDIARVLKACGRIKGLSIKAQSISCGALDYTAKEMKLQALQVACRGVDSNEFQSTLSPTISKLRLDAASAMRVDLASLGSAVSKLDVEVMSESMATLSALSGKQLESLTITVKDKLVLRPRIKELVKARNVRFVGENVSLLLEIVNAGCVEELVIDSEFCPAGKVAEFCRQAESLQKIKWHGIECIDWNVLKELKSLRCLSVTGCSPSLPVSLLRSLPSLSEIQIDEMSIEKSVETYEQWLPDCEYISLRGFSHIGGKQLRALCALARIKEITLSECGLLEGEYSQICGKVGAPRLYVYNSCVSPRTYMMLKECGFDLVFPAEYYHCRMETEESGVVMAVGFAQQFGSAASSLQYEDINDEGKIRQWVTGGCRFSGFGCIDESSRVGYRLFVCVSSLFPKPYDRGYIILNTGKIYKVGNIAKMWQMGESKLSQWRQYEEFADELDMVEIGAYRVVYSR